MITEDGRAVEPGSGEIGRVAVGGFQPDRLLQGPREDGGHVHRPSRGAATRARRLRHRSRPTARSPCSAAGRCASTPAARRSSPRRSRRSSRPTRPCTTPSPSACPTRSSARPSPPSSSRRRAPTLDAADLIAHVKAKLAVVQGAQARRRRSTRSAGPPTARSTTSGSRPTPPTQLGVPLTAGSGADAHRPIPTLPDPVLPTSPGPRGPADPAPAGPRPPAVADRPRRPTRSSPWTPAPVDVRRAMTVSGADHGHRRAPRAAARRRRRRLARRRGRRRSASSSPAGCSSPLLAGLGHRHRHGLPPAVGPRHRARSTPSTRASSSAPSPTSTSPQFDGIVLQAVGRHRSACSR